jgi:hypothetical protein
MSLARAHSLALHWPSGRGEETVGGRLRSVGCSRAITLIASTTISVTASLLSSPYYYCYYYFRCHCYYFSATITLLLLIFLCFT